MLNDAEFLDLQALILSLVDGLEGGTYKGTCVCSRPIHLRLGISPALQELLPTYRAELQRRRGTLSIVQNSHFAFIEVDDRS